MHLSRQIGEHPEGDRIRFEQYQQDPPCCQL